MATRKTSKNTDKTSENSLAGDVFGDEPAPPPRESVVSPPPAQAPGDEPTEEQIDRIDTREEAEAIYRSIRAKLRGADDVRYASLAEKALAAINRIEQIDRFRPRVVAPDEVTRRLVEVREAAETRILAIVIEREEKLASDRGEFAAWARGAFGELGGAEAVRRVDAMLGGAA